MSVLATFLTAVSCVGDQGPLLPNEEAHRANNRGVAFLEQFDYETASDAFEAALALDDALTAARVNLALARFLTQDLEGAEQAATAAAAALPAAPQPSYLLGLIARAGNRTDDAIQAFSAVLEADPADVGTNIHLGQIYLEAGDYPAAIERLRVAYADAPYNVTAVYNLGLALVRSGDTDEGRGLLEQAQVLRTTGYGVTYGTGYLQQGRYAEAIASTGAESVLVDPDVPPAAFTAVTIAALPPSVAGVSPFGQRYTGDELTEQGARAIAAGFGGGLTPIDFDRDDDLDLFVARPGGQYLLRNDGPDGWIEVTAEAGLADVSTERVPIGVIAADYDNDEVSDLFVLGHDGGRLYRNNGAGGFTDVTAEAGLPDFPFLPGAAAFADIDHDGDVDLLIAGLADLAASRSAAGAGGLLFPEEFAPAPLLVLRNNQDGTFTDITAETGLGFDGHAVALVPTDFDNGRDLDLLVIDRGGPPRLFMNLRDYTFRDVASEVGLAGVGSSGVTIATADVNKDGFPDFVLGRDDDAVLAMSDGRGRFDLVEAPGDVAGASVTRFLDYDNDGLLDLLLWTPEAPRLFRNLGDTWDEVTGAAIAGLAGLTPMTTARAMAVADIDGDGDSDIVTAASAAVTVGENSGDSRNGSLRVTLRGFASNRAGVGAKVQLRAGSLSARLETSSSSPAVAPADVVFGLGRRPGADVARILWPSGTLQAEVPASDGSFLPASLSIRELDREPSSCPFLFTWNGAEFEFVTDFLGGGEMGYSHGPGHYNSPDPVEYVRIRGDQLRPREGMLEVRVTNELEEAVFLDQVELVTLTHPDDIELYPNEGMTEPAKAYRLHGVRDVRVPAAALDDDGDDVTERIARLDRRYPDGFTLAAFRGYAEPHALTLDLGPGDGRRVLLLTGWTSYAFSSDNVAAVQAGLAPVLPALEIKSMDGRWRPATVDIGIPVGRPQTIAVDLTGQLRPGEREVRIVTSMRIYWDQILVGRPASTRNVDERRLSPTRATLRARGFSAEMHPEGTQPTIYDYGRVTRTSPWKTMIGAYTREGDVLPLVTATDDMFVVGRDGDEIALGFDASELGPIPDGWTRTYFLHADGFSKEMDINSASPDTVAPLPFHAMSGYPYGSSERYPDDPSHRRYLDTYNTRAVLQSVPPIETAK